MLSKMVGFFERRVVHQEAELFGRQRLRLCRCKGRRENVPRGRLDTNLTLPGVDTQQLSSQMLSPVPMSIMTINWVRVR